MALAFEFCAWVSVDQRATPPVVLKVQSTVLYGSPLWALTSRKNGLEMLAQSVGMVNARAPWCEVRF